MAPQEDSTIMQVIKLEKIMQILKSAALLLSPLMVTLSGAAVAQSAEFPTKPITIVFTAGGPGSVDTEYRFHTEAMRTIPNMPTFTFEYRGGAGGLLALR